MKKETYKELKSRLEKAESELETIRHGKFNNVAGANLCQCQTDLEAPEKHIKHVLLAIRSVNQLIVKENDPGLLIEKACVALTEGMGYYNAWIALLEKNGAKVLDTASSGFEGEFQTLEKELIDGKFTNCMKLSLRQFATTVTVNNPIENCPDCPLSKRYGASSGFSKSLEFGGRVYGILAVSVPAKFADDPEEKELFSELASDLGFALHKIDTNRRLCEIQRIVNRSSSIACLWKNSQGWPVEFVSENISQFGYSAEDFYSGRISFSKIVYPEDLERIMMEVGTYSKDITCDNFIQEYRIVSPEGKIFWIEDRTNIRRNERGEITHFEGIICDISERVAAEEHLKKVNEDQAWLLKSMTNAFVIFDSVFDDSGNFVSYRFHYVNDAYERITGVRLDEIMGRTVHEVWPETEISWIENYGAVAMTGEARIFDMFHKPTAKYYHCHAYRPWKTNVRFCVIFEDITERIKVREKLRDSDRMFNHAVDMLCIAGFDGYFKVLNPSWTRTLGWSPDELKSKSWIEFVHPDDVQATENVKTQLIGGICFSQFENRYRCKDGSYRWISWNSFPYPDENIIFSTARDISLAKEKEAQITLLGQMLDDAPASITIHDIDGRFLYANKATLKLHGYDKIEEFLAVNLHDLDFPESESLLEGRLRQIAINGHASFEVFHYRKDGSSFPMHVLAKVIEWKGLPSVLSIASDISEKKKAEEEIIRSNNILHAVLNSIPASVFWKDKNSVYLGCNRQFAHDAGFNSPAELIGKDDFEILPIAQAEAYRADDLAVIENGTAKILYEEEQIRPNGRKIQLLASKVPLADAEGNISGILGTHLDITERKTHEILLAQEKAWSERIVSCAPVIIVALSEKSRIVTFNKFAERITGYKADEVIGKEWIEIFIPEKIRRDIHHVWDEIVRNREIAHQYEEAIVVKDGSGRLISWNNTIVMENNEFKMVLSIGEDITERRKIEMSLIENEEKFRNYVEMAPYAIFIADRDGRYVDVNPAASSITGYSREELLTICISDILPPEGLEDGLMHFRRLVETGEINSAQIPFLRKNGEKRLWKISAARINENRFLGFAEDITALKSAEGERRKLEEQLRQSQKLEAVGQLAGGIAHDFNNALQVINGYAQIMLMDIDKDFKYKKSIESILHSGKHAAELTRQLLAFSRRQVLRLEYLDLNQVVGELMDMLARVISENIRIDFVSGHELASLHADRSQIEQIIMNLCLNARDSMPDGGKLSIETENAFLDGMYCKVHEWAKPGRFVLLSISDTGHGMDTEIQSHIFEPFFTTKEPGRGTGLGLSTVYGIVRQHNGYINVYSEPGKGSTIKIYLPAAIRKATEVGTKMATKILGGNETILIAEDDENVLNFVKTILEKHGYTAICAANGRKAVDEFKKNPDKISLVLVDVVMPDMNGKEVYEELKKDFPKVKFLFSSGYNQDLVHKGFVLDDNIRLVQKPYDMEELFKSIRKILDE